MKKILQLTHYLILLAAFIQSHSRASELVVLPVQEPILIGKGRSVGSFLAQPIENIDFPADVWRMILGYLNPHDPAFRYLASYYMPPKEKLMHLADDIEALVIVLTAVEENDPSMGDRRLSVKNMQKLLRWNEITLTGGVSGIVAEKLDNPLLKQLKKMLKTERCITFCLPLLRGENHNKSCTELKKELDRRVKTNADLVTSLRKILYNSSSSIRRNFLNTCIKAITDEIKNRETLIEYHDLSDKLFTPAHFHTEPFKDKVGLLKPSVEQKRQLYFLMFKGKELTQTCNLLLKEFAQPHECVHATALGVAGIASTYGILFLPVIFSISWITGNKRVSYILGSTNLIATTCLVLHGISKLKTSGLRDPHYISSSRMRKQLQKAFWVLTQEIWIWAKKDTLRRYAIERRLSPEIQHIQDATKVVIETLDI